MKSLLNALQEGRLVELPVKDKDKALEYLALLIEAIPDIGTSQDIVKAVKDREATANTGIGMGVACPHIRADHDGELFCAVGWSPEGIEYESPDKNKVHLLIMYYIPNSQRNSYLKEVSGLAKAIKETNALEMLSSASDLQSVRNKLLDWVEIAIDKAIPDAKARMIKIEERQAKSASGALPEPAAPHGLKLSVIPFTAVLFEGGRCLVLSGDDSLAGHLESKPDFVGLLTQAGQPAFESNGFHISVLFSAVYPQSRQLFECVAIRSS